MQSSTLFHISCPQCIVSVLHIPLWIVTDRFFCKERLRCLFVSAFMAAYQSLHLVVRTIIVHELFPQTDWLLHAIVWRNTAQCSSCSARCSSHVLMILRQDSVNTKCACLGEPHWTLNCSQDVSPHLWHWNIFGLRITRVVFVVRTSFFWFIFQSCMQSWPDSA